MTKAASLSDALIAAGVPVLTVTQNGDTLTVVYDPAITPQQRATGDGIVAGFDVSDAAQAARDDTAAVTAATALATDKAAPNKLLRAAALLMMDEINVLRARLRAQDAAVAAATSFADLKARWAALTLVPDRTAAQIKPALVARVSTPEAD